MTATALPTGDLASIKAGEEAIEKAASDIKTVIDLLNRARSCSLTFANNTSQTWQLVDTHHDHGEFSTSPQGVVRPQETALFSSQSSANSIATGCEGTVTYGLPDGETIVLRWDNPFVGSNSSSVELGGPGHSRFRTISSTGGGDQKAPMRYDVFDIEMRGFPVYGAILDKWAELDWGAGPLRFPVSNEIPTYDGVGRYRNFEGGIVSWHPETNAHIVWGLIGERWLQIGREAFGYPITDETPCADGVGRYNHFRAVQLAGKPEASIFWHPATGAWEVYGGIRAQWAAMGWERSPLGYPMGAEQDQNGGRIQRFQHGGLFWTAVGGVVVVP